MESLFRALFRIVFGQFVGIDLRHCTALRLGPTVAVKHLAVPVQVCVVPGTQYQACYALYRLLFRSFHRALSTALHVGAFGTYCGLEVLVSVSRLWDFVLGCSLAVAVGLLPVGRVTSASSLQNRAFVLLCDVL